MINDNNQLVTLSVAEECSSEGGNDPAADILARSRNLRGTRRTMSNGRAERRIAKTVKVEVCPLDDPKLKERALTENVSAHGARVLIQQAFRPQQQAVLTSPNEGVWSPAKVVYCQRVPGNRFAVGLELSARVEPWARAY
jgi:PilZ domain-containing protein